MKTLVFFMLISSVAYSSKPLDRKTVQDIFDSIPHVDSRSVSPKPENPPVQPQPQSPVLPK